MKTKVLLYCTKAKPFLLNIKGEYVLDSKDLWSKYNYNPNDINEILNGKIVAECEIDVEKIIFEEAIDDCGYSTNSLFSNELEEQSCLTFHQLDKYFQGKNGYALHISDLKTFDESHKLKDYYIDNSKCHGLFGWCLKYRYTPITKVPQNMCRVYKDNQEYVLISIKPEYLCKILNGEKTIEIRKKVLNCMKE